MAIGHFVSAGRCQVEAYQALGFSPCVPVRLAGDRGLRLNTGTAARNNKQLHIIISIIRAQEMRACFQHSFELIVRWGKSLFCLGFFFLFKE